MSQCDRILEALRKSDKALTVNELNNTALADLDIPNGRVSARINKLRDKGEVVEADKRKDMFTERTSKTWTDVVSQDNTKTADSVQNSNTTESNEFVSMSEADQLEDGEKPKVFVDSTQNPEKVCNDNEQVLMEKGKIV